MNKIFKWFTVPGERLTLVRIAWFVSRFDVEDFTGVDKILYLFLKYCADLDIPAVRQFLVTFMLTDGKQLIKKYDIRLDTMENFRYDEPASLEEACRVITQTALTTYDIYVAESLGDSSFKVDMALYMDEQKKDRLQTLMAESFPRLSNGDQLEEVIDSMEYSMSRIKDIYDKKHLDKLDFMSGDVMVTKGIKKMRLLLTTGIPCIDEDSGGLHSQQVWSFTGGPGTGKTRFAEGYIVYRALVVSKLDVVMHELELSEEEVMNILIAHHIVFLYKGQVKIADKDMTNNRLTPEQKRYYEAAKIDLFESGKYGKFTIITDDLVVETMEKDMYSFLKHNRNCQLWVIDYAGLAKSRPIAKFDKRYDGYEIIVELYRRAKEIAKTADIGVFIINQFNDKGVEASEQGKPILPGYTQGGFIASRQADYDLAMTMTQAQKLANLCMLSTVKERAAVGFKNQPLSRDLAVSIYRQIKKQEGM